jgi:hypothetical protein
MDLLFTGAYCLNKTWPVYWWSSYAVAKCLLEALPEPFQPSLSKTGYLL